MIRPEESGVHPANQEATAGKPCPYCAETVHSEAKKCKHCGEFLDPKLRTKNAQGSRPAFSAGVAALLSLIIPGAGQMYKGQVINGLMWFCVTAIGYAAFIAPGLFFHFCCILGAASGARDK